MSATTHSAGQPEHFTDDPLTRPPGATLWAFVVGILVGVALGALR